MKTSDFYIKPSSKNINESMKKKFGEKLDLDSYTDDQLNKTFQLIENKMAGYKNSKFNDTLKSEEYHRLTVMRDAVKTAISERKAKPDFLDLDKDGNKKEPMKKAVADKKDGPKKGVNPFAKKDVKEATKTDKPWTDMSGKKQPGTAVKGDKYTGKEADKEAKSKKDESTTRSKKVVAESVEQKLSFREMMTLVVESGGQQQIDAVDQELFAWAQRVAKQKLGEGMKAEVYAGMVYERMGGVFEMYDVLAEDQN